MGRKMKKLTRAGAGALAGVMVFGLAAPLAPLSVEAADEVKNLAIGSTATVNDKETDYWGADKAVDGIVNRTAAKRDQSGNVLTVFVCNLREFRECLLCGSARTCRCACIIALFLCATAHVWKASNHNKHL